MRRHLRALLFVGLALGAAEATAQDAWPSKPIRFIVAQNVATAPDVACRIVTEKLSAVLGQQVIVDNRGGGGGNVLGTSIAARAAPDGYTFYFATAAGLVSDIYLNKSLPYDPAKDFVPVSMVGKSGHLIVANNNAPVNTLDDIIAYDKANPGKLSVAITGPKLFAGIMGAWINKVAGTNLTLVAYNQNAQGLQDTIAGRVQVNIQTVTTALPFVKAGQLKPIAVSSLGPYPGVDGVPSISKTLPGFELIGWYGIVAPTGTPAPILEKHNAAVDRALKDPDVLAKLQNVGVFTVGSSTPADFAEHLGKERKLWGDIVKTLGIEPD